MTADTSMGALVARSFLFVPGNRPERFERACSAGADAVIVDLEDAVPPDQKAEARDALAKWLSPARPVCVRVNAPGTQWHREDLALCTLPGVAAIVLPKAEHLDDGVLSLCAGGARALLPLVETAAGFDMLRALARAPGVQRLLFGSIDFQVDLGIDGEGEELLYFRSRLVLESRLAGIQPPVDGVCTEIDDPEMLQADTLRARRLGFGGKLCIHPRQVAVVQQAFSASPQERAWAQRVVAAAQAAGGAAVAVDGRMVDLPVLRRAQALMQAAG